MEVVGYVMLSALVLYMVQQIADLATYKPGLERGRKVHALLDAEMSRADKTRISCREGCASCCHFEVEITKDDAEVLAHAVFIGDVSVDRNRLGAVLCCRYWWRPHQWPEAHRCDARF